MDMMYGNMENIWIFQFVLLRLQFPSSLTRSRSKLNLKSSSNRLMLSYSSSSRSIIRLAESVVNTSRNAAAAARRRESSASLVRREVSQEERAALRASRKERANAFIGGIGPATAVEGAEEIASGEIAAGSAIAAGAQKMTAASSGPTFDASRLGWYAAVIIPTAFIGWGIMDKNSPPGKLSQMIGLTSVLEEYAKPARTKLLPDWNQIPNIPPDFPAPPCLVIDLESTLVCSTWDRKYGWRHAKRPGVDKFLALMAQYYEVVIWTPSPDGLAGPVVESLDSKGYVMHRLFRDATNYSDGVHCKDLSWLNRPVRKIIALDDDPDALKFQPDNLIRMKPYDDPSVEDDTLERITPLLVEISREGYEDIPGLLKQFRGMDADEIATDFERRVNDLRERSRMTASRGLGSLASTSKYMPAPELPPNLPGSDGGVQQLTAKDLVGSAPPSESSESGVMGWLQRRQKLAEEQNKEKFELWNEVMMRKQAEKKRRMEGHQ